MPFVPIFGPIFAYSWLKHFSELVSHQAGLAFFDDGPIMHSVIPTADCAPDSEKVQNSNLNSQLISDSADSFRTF